MLKESALTLLGMVALFQDALTTGEDCNTSLTITAFSSISNSTTTYLEPGTTRSLVINCSFNVNTSNRLTHQHILDLLHSFDEADYSVLLNFFDGDDVVRPESESEWTTFGINDEGELYLSREFPYPGQDRAGIYTCLANINNMSIGAEQSEGKACESSKRILVNECIKSFTMTTISPQGTTEALQINCTIDLRGLAEMFILDSLTISHSVDKTNYQEVFTLDNITGRVDDLSSSKGGLIKQFSESYVRVELANPDNSKVGTYQCEAKGRTRSGDPYSCFDTKEITNLTTGKACETSLTITAFSSTTNCTTLYIEPGTTRSLVINCSFNIDASVRLTKQIILDFSHSFDEENYTVIHYFFDGYHLVGPESERELPTYGVNDEGDMYLSREFPYPGQDRAGIYMCEAEIYNMNSNGAKQLEGKRCASYKRILVDKCIKSFTITTVPLQADPECTHIQPGTTEALRINCTIDLRGLAEMFILDSLTVYHHSVNKTNYQEVFTLDNITGRVDDLSSSNGGLINQFSESYVRVELPNQDNANVGTYKCEAKGRTRSGDPYSCFDTKEISIKKKTETCETAFKITAELQEVEGTVNPKTYENYVVIIKHLLVKCSVKVSETSDLDSLTTLTLLQSKVNGSKYETVASINTTSEPFNISASGIIMGEGVISNTSESYLYVQWKYPNFEVAGSYMCEANGISYTGQPQKCSVSVSPIIFLSEWQRGDCFPFLNVQALSDISKSNTRKSNAIITHIEQETTKNLLINCSIDVEKTPELDFLHDIDLLFAGINEHNFKIVASLLDRDVENVDGKSTHSVHNSEKKSYLSVELKNPKAARAGTYRCEAKGGYGSSQRKICWASTQVRMLTFENLFVESQLHNGRRYFFRKTTATISYELAQDTCSKHGGYLAEINNANELHFVSGFLNNHTYNSQPYKSFLISGNDKMEKGTFLYPRTNQTVEYVFWAGWEPSGGNDENCLFMEKYRKEDYSWSLYDSQCVIKNPNNEYSYLCEMEHNR